MPYSADLVNAGFTNEDLDIFCKRAELSRSLIIGSYFEGVFALKLEKGANFVEDGGNGLCINWSAQREWRMKA